MASIIDVCWFMRNDTSEVPNDEIMRRHSTLYPTLPYVRKGNVANPMGITYRRVLYFDCHKLSLCLIDDLKVTSNNIPEVSNDEMTRTHSILDTNPIQVSRAPKLVFCLLDNLKVMSNDRSQVSKGEISWGYTMT